MSKFYKQALTLIRNRNFNTEELVLRLAQEHPAIFVKLLTPAVVQPVVPDWFIHGVVRIAHTQAAQAIKKLRQETGLDLRSAKGIVDEIRWGDNAGFPDVLNSAICQAVLDHWRGKTWADLVKAAKAV